MKTTLWPFFGWIYLHLLKLNGWPASAAGLYEIEWVISSILQPSEIEWFYFAIECYVKFVKLNNSIVECRFNRAFILKGYWMNQVLKWTSFCWNWLGQPILILLLLLNKVLSGIIIISLYSCARLRHVQSFLGAGENKETSDGTDAILCILGIDSRSVVALWWCPCPPFHFNDSGCEANNSQKTQLNHCTRQEPRFRCGREAT